jgi:hypothetical protein
VFFDKQVIEKYEKSEQLECFQKFSIPFKIPITI